MPAFIGCETNEANRPSSDSIELLVSAAISLSDSLGQVKSVYEKKQSQIRLSFNFGASGALRQQIEQGAAADIFLSADEQNMKLLVDKLLIDAAQLSVFLANELVVIVPADSTVQLVQIKDLLHNQFKYVALGEPGTVPAGTYAREALTYLQQWDALQGKAVFGNNVRQVLAYVETGNADAGFVYKTDALSSSKVKIALSLDSSSHGPIHYYAGIVKETKHAKQAQAFYEFLKENEAQEIFIKYGFKAIK